MPLKPVEKPLKMEKNRKEGEKPTHRRPSGNFPKKKDKFGRKRSQSFSGGSGKFCAPYKCRKRPMLPTKFLLGGNICDPLNLNSLQDEEINRTVNAVTPKSSPIPTPPQRRGHIEVIIPPNIHDPLNLIDCSDDLEYEQQLTSPVKKGNKRRKKKKRTSSATTEISDADISSASEAQMPDISVDSAKIPEIDSSVSEDNNSPPAKLVKITKDLRLELSPQKDKKRKSDGHGKEGVKKLRRMDSMDKIVSPVVPQPGAWMKRPVQFSRGPGSSTKGHSRPGKKDNFDQEIKMPVFKQKNKAFQYGNYNRYYGYRNLNHEVDPRLKCFAAYRYLFIGKDILDIGCNIGHITLTVARDFGAKSVVGLDIDKKLIGIARKNVRHYVNCYDSPREESQEQAPGQSSRSEVHNDKFFPISMPILYGPVDVPGINDEQRGKGFPHNVTFVQGNYVLEDDALLATDQTQFDVILCLSVTKWMHLNWGDAGMKQAFRRMYAQLRPGGTLILEPQSWTSYKHKKHLTETIYKNYSSIEFFPEKFTQYLLSSEVGFAKSEIMGHPHHMSKGFQRPIQIFTKSDLSPSQSQRSHSATPSHTVTSLSCSKKVYTSIATPEMISERSYTSLTSPVQPLVSEENVQFLVSSNRSSKAIIDQKLYSSRTIDKGGSNNNPKPKEFDCVYTCPTQNSCGSLMPTSVYEEDHILLSSCHKSGSATVSSTKRKVPTEEGEYTCVDVRSVTSEQTNSRKRSAATLSSSHPAKKTKGDQSSTHSVLHNVVTKAMLTDVTPVLNDAIHNFKNAMPVTNEVSTHQGVATPILKDGTLLITGITPLVKVNTLCINQVTPLVKVATPIQEVTPLVKVTTPFQEVTPLVKITTPFQEVIPLVNVNATLQEVTPLVKVPRPIQEVTPLVQFSTPFQKATPLVKVATPIQEVAPLVKEVTPLVKITPLVKVDTSVLMNATPVLNDATIILKDIATSMKDDRSVKDVPYINDITPSSKDATTLVENTIPTKDARTKDATPFNNEYLLKNATLLTKSFIREASPPTNDFIKEAITPMTEATPVMKDAVSLIKDATVSVKDYRLSVKDITPLINNTTPVKKDSICIKESAPTNDTIFFMKDVRESMLTIKDKDVAPHIKNAVSPMEVTAPSIKESARVRSIKDARLSIKDSACLVKNTMSANESALARKDVVSTKKAVACETSLLQVAVCSPSNKSDETDSNEILACSEQVYTCLFRQSVDENGTESCVNSSRRHESNTVVNNNKDSSISFKEVVVNVEPCRNDTLDNT